MLNVYLSNIPVKHSVSHSVVQIKSRAEVLMANKQQTHEHVTQDLKI